MWVESPRSRAASEISSRASTLPHRPAAEIGGVLDRDQARALEVREAGAADRPAHLVGGEHPPLAGQGTQHHPRERGRGTALEVHGMAGLVQDDLVPRLGVGAVRDLVAHGSGGKEQRRVLAQQLRHHRAELQHRGVLVALLVADLGVRHRLAHRPRGAGLGVAVQIDPRSLAHLVLLSRAPPVLEVVPRHHQAAPARSRRERGTGRGRVAPRTPCGGRSSAGCAPRPCARATVPIGSPA